MTDERSFHPELRAARFIPPLAFGPLLTSIVQKYDPKPRPVPADVFAEDLLLPGPAGAPEVRVRLYRPRDLAGPAPALVWIHGGGMLIGNRLQDEGSNVRLVRELGITVMSVEYRLAPLNPAPAALEDCYAAVAWLFENAREVNVDPARIAIGGASAGGGLAAGVVALCHDRGRFAPAFQLLIYPMLDDRTAARTDADTRNARMWTPRSNRWAWSVYLGQAPGSAGVSMYSAPARRQDLRGLPPAWLGVGTLDVFHDEDIEYARRLRESGVPTQTEIVPGAFHAFDVVMPARPVSESFRASWVHALRGALFDL